jgi:hypothetical protein
MSANVRHLKHGPENSHLSGVRPRRRPEHQQHEVSDEKKLSGILVSALMMGTVALAESPRRAVGKPTGGILARCWAC